MFADCDRATSLVGLVPEITRLAAEQKANPLRPPRCEPRYFGDQMAFIVGDVANYNEVLLDDDGMNIPANAQPVILRCDNCELYFATSEASEAHVAEDIAPIYECEVCHVWFADQYVAWQHWYMYHVADETHDRYHKYFICKICPFRTMKEDEFDRHTVFEHQRKLRCGRGGCDLSFNSKKERRKHTISHNRNLRTCGTCGFEGVGLTFKRHLAEHKIAPLAGQSPEFKWDPTASLVGILPELAILPKVEPGSQSSVPKQGELSDIMWSVYTAPDGEQWDDWGDVGENHGFQCNVCWGCFKDKESADAHMADFMKQHNRVCHICNVLFNSIGDRRIHEDKFHLLTEQSKLTCHLCPEQRMYPLAMDKHIAKWHGKDTFFCCIPDCHREFLTKTERLRHVRDHDKKDRDRVICRSRRRGRVKRATAPAEQPVESQ